ncbi:hypothetical protein JCM3765_001304 [Sporobolomyces pararoseus]
MPNNAHLPSLLRNLTSSSSRPTASISLDSPSPSALTNDDNQSIASHSSKSKSQRRRRTVTDPAGKQPSNSPTSTSRTSSPRPKRASGINRQDGEEESPETRSRSSSGSSLEGLTARLHGARRGRENSAKSGNHAEMTSADKGKGRERVRSEQKHQGEADRKAATEQPLELSSVPTISLSTEQVESQHGTTRVVTPDLSEPPPPLTVPTPFESPALSSHSSNFDPQPPPPPRIKVNDNEQNDERGPTATTFTSSQSLSDLSDDDDNSTQSRSDSEKDDDAKSETGSLNMVSRSDLHPDPRDLLRSQLAKAGTGHSDGRTSDELREDKEMEQERRIIMNRTSSGMSSRSTLGAGTENDRAISRAYEKRRYFILSTAGKLVYTSDTDEDMASGLVGVMQAIVSIFADEGDKIRCVEVGDSRITFLLKSPLYLVVSSSWGEPESVLRTHLDHLYLQVLSVVTLTQLQSIFSRRSNFDLRRMMEGTEPFFHSLVSSVQTSIPILTASMEVYRIDPNIRAEIAKALDPGREATKQLDLLYVLLLARGRLVTLLRPKKHSIHPTDLHLLLSTIYSSSPRARSKPAPNNVDPLKIEDQASEDLHVEDDEERRSSPLTEPGLESWLPICLPRFNAKGFLHAYVSFLNSTSTSSSTTSTSEGGGIGLVLLSSDREGFLGVKEAAEGIKERLLSATGTGGDLVVSAGSNGRSKNRKGGKAAGGLVHEIEKARVLQEYSLVELAIPGLRHFVYKSRSLVQSTRPAWEGDYRGVNDRYRLITLYQQLSDALHPRPAQSGTPATKPAQVQYLRTEKEAVLGWSTAQFEIYVATSPLLPHSAVVSAAKGVSKWVEREEQKLFLTSSPSF